MGFFDDQIRQRNKNDEELYKSSFEKLSRKVLGDRTGSGRTDHKYTLESALEDIFAFYGHKSVAIPAYITDFNKKIDFCTNSVGMMKRKITLEGRWYLDSFGPLLTLLRGTGDPVVLFPIGFTGYYFYDRETGKRVVINKKRLDLLDETAYCFYNPLPLKKLGISELVSYMKSCVSSYDVVFFILVTLIATGISMVTPQLSLVMTSMVLEEKSINLLLVLAIAIASAELLSNILDSVKKVITARVKWKVTIPVEGAVIHRILSLPTAFFRDYSAGELTIRAGSVSAICEMIIRDLFSMGITSIIALMYVLQIFTITPLLVVPALLITFVTILHNIISTLVQMKVTKKQMELAASEYGLTYALISGIQKIRLAGAEKRAFAKWVSEYAEQASLTYNPPLFLKLNKVINMAISLTGTIVLYYLAIKAGVKAANFYAFTIVYGFVAEAFSQMAKVSLSLAEIRPVFELAEPILKAEPEIKENRGVIKRLSGSIEFNRVSFRYSDNEPYLLNDFSLKIRPGDYVAIVGKTGCGKSTLIRLILGFEKPRKGAVYIDGMDISRVNIQALRRKIGSVLQDGKLFFGNIFENIEVASDNLTEEEAWEAAEIAGIADDIKSMPMGMNTVIAEGQGGISGGQKQRILIARAIASKPKILIFDEATSALDNITQKKISDALDNLKCTRIVVAHRLSTIRNCNRIMVLSEGNIIEEGTYDELMELRGSFYELVENQQL